MTTAKRDAMSVEGFTHRVELACADLPDQVRQRLIADLFVHLRELDEGADLLETLGPPEDYARDLREAMELPGARTAAPGAPPRWPGPAGRWQLPTGRRRWLLAAGVGVAIVIIIVALIGIGHTRPASPAAPATPAPRAAAVIMVPDLIGLSPAAATAELAAAGLRPQFEIDPNGSPGVVSSETPTAGTVVAPGSTILVRTGAGSS